MSDNSWDDEDPFADPRPRGSHAPRHVANGTSSDHSDDPFGQEAPGWARDARDAAQHTARAGNWFARHKVVTVLAVVVFFGIVGIAAGGEDEPPTTANDNTSNSSSQAPDTTGQEADEPSGTDPDSEEGQGASKSNSSTKDRRSHRTDLVARIVDGDTLELGNGQTVRLVGIDTPERDECGYEAASNNLSRLVLGKQVRLTESDEDTDRYGRLLRYVNVGPMDAGLRQIRQGFAIARYDSRDGYGFHAREPIYIKADNGSKQFSCPEPRPSQPSGGGNCMTGYSPCLPIVSDLDCADVTGPVRVTGSDPYRLDADGDGIGCDS